MNLERNPINDDDVDVDDDVGKPNREATGFVVPSSSSSSTITSLCERGIASLHTERLIWLMISLGSECDDDVDECWKAGM